MRLNIKNLEKLVEQTIDEADKKEKKKKKACGDDKPYGKWHSSKDGKFTDPKDEDACWSLYDVAPECGRTRSKAGSKKRYAISKPATSGRRGKGKERTHKCSTNEPVKETTKTILRSELDRIIREEIQAMLEIMPKKSASHKRRVRRNYDEETVRQNRLDALTHRNSLSDELEKQYAPLRSLGHGIFQEDAIMSGDDKRDQEELKIKLYAVEALRDVLNDMEDDVLMAEEDEDKLDALYQYHKGKQDRKDKLIKLKKTLCPPCKGATVGGIANNLNAIALSLKGKLNDPPKNEK